jgi:hypothetical protein
VLRVLVLTVLKVQRTLSICSASTFGTFSTGTFSTLRHRQHL